MSIKQKTRSGLLWSFIDNFANMGIQFIIGIILARLLSPKEFGLIGMLTIFIAVSQSFINSGFSQALIRKKEPTQVDYSTVFYFNLIIGVVCFLILFFCAGIISRFLNEPRLKLLVQLLGLSLIINAFTIIQQTILIRRIDFKLQTKISISRLWCFESGDKNDYHVCNNLFSSLVVEQMETAFSFQHSII
jgi:teichuronic acid exporter